MLARGREHEKARRDRRRAARPGGRPRRCRATGCTSRSCTPAPPDEHAARRRRRARSSSERREARHRRPPGRAPPRSSAPDRVARRRARRRPARSTPTCWSSPPASGRTPTSPPLGGLEVERGIVVDDQLRTDDPDVYAIGECAQHRGEVYGLVAPAVGARPGAGRRAHRHRPRRRVPRQPDGDEAQGRRRRRRRHGDQHARSGTTTSSW